MTATEVPRLHDRNRNFTWPETRTGPVTLTQDQLNAWHEQGFFVLRQVLDPDLLARVEADIDPLEAEREDMMRRLGGRQGISQADAITFTVHIVLQSVAARELVTAAPLTGLAKDLLGDNVRLYWDQGVYKKPENPAEFPWHQDNGYTFVEPQTYLTCWIPLNSATVENGAPWVVPELHRLGTLHHRWTDLGFECLADPEGAVSLAAEPGDVIVFSSLTPHRTGPNLTDTVRKAYIVQYAADGTAMYPRDQDGPLPQQHPDRQFPVLLNGEAVSAPKLSD